MDGALALLMILLAALTRSTVATLYTCSSSVCAGDGVEVVLQAWPHIASHVAPTDMQMMHTLLDYRLYHRDRPFAAVELKHPARALVLPLRQKRIESKLL